MKRWQGDLFFGFSCVYLSDFNSLQKCARTKRIPSIFPHVADNMKCLWFIFTHTQQHGHTIKCRPRWHKFLVQYENFHAAEIQIRRLVSMRCWTVLPTKRLTEQKEKKDQEQSGSIAWLWFRAQPHSKWHLGPFPRPSSFVWFLVISLIGSLLRTSVGHVAVTRGSPLCSFVYLMLSSNNISRDTVGFVTDTDTFGPPACLAFSLGVSAPFCVYCMDGIVFPCPPAFFTRNTRKSNMDFLLSGFQSKYVCMARINL